MSGLRGIRGAIRLEKNSKEEIFNATRKLLLKMIEENDIDPSDIASVFFTATDDIDADFPAYAARDLGWNMVPLLCAREMKVPGSMTRLIRILIHVNTDKAQNQIKHQYLGETWNLRPDISGGNDDDSRHEG